MNSPGPLVRSKSPALAATPISRPGRIIQLTLSTDASGNVTTASGNVLNLAVNSFYIIDSPYPLLIRTGISAASAYPSQTGESFPQAMDRLTVVQVVGLASGSSLVVKIWVGEDSVTGFIDNRTFPANNSLEIIYPDIINSPTSVAAGTTSTITASFASLNNICTEMLIANLDPSNTVSLVNSAVSSTVIVPLFPLQVYRLPVTQQTANAVVVSNSIVIFVKNTNATAVSISVAWILRNNGVGMEVGP